KKPEERYPTVDAFITDAERAASDPFVMPVAPVKPPAPAPTPAPAPAAALAAAVRQLAATPPATPPQLVSGAGGTHSAAPRRSKRPLIAGLAILAVTLLAAALILLRPENTSATRTEDAPKAAAEDITP